MGTMVWTVAFDGTERRKVKPAQAKIELFTKSDNGQWYGILKWRNHIEVVMAEHIFHSKEECLKFCSAHNTGSFPDKHDNLSENTGLNVVDVDFEDIE